MIETITGFRGKVAQEKNIQSQWEEWGGISEVATGQKRREIVCKMSSLLEASASKVRLNC